MVEIVTFGCRLNAVESDAMRRAAETAGLQDAVLVNSCAVTAEAVRQARQSVRRIARERPGARIVVSGCAAQTEPQTFAAMDEVARVVGNGEKLDPESYSGLDGAAPDRLVTVGDVFEDPRPVTAIDSGEARTRAFLRVQTGCDHRCTFCVIPFGRGASRSVPLDEAVSRAEELVARGTAEIVLTGVDLTAYGADLPERPRLGTLVRAILGRVPELKRLRISSIDSVEVDEELMIALGDEERLMPHLHLSLQAGDDMILKRMKRRHSRDDALRFCERARRLRPDIVFGADLIAGFPTETDEMFENSLRLVDECDIARLHVFPFSPRPGTPAARMPQLDRAVIKERAARLRARGAARLERHLAAQVGRRHLVLVEAEGRGRTEDFSPVRLEEAGEAGRILPALVIGHDGSVLEARAA